MEPVCSVALRSEARHGQTCSIRCPARSHSEGEAGALIDGRAGGFAVWFSWQNLSDIAVWKIAAASVSSLFFFSLKKDFPVS